MAVQSASGMLFFGLYRDQQFALDAWRVNDPVTLFVAVPLVCASLALATRGSLRGVLLLLGSMYYALYNYSFYLFGAALNTHFLLYVTLVIISALSLIAGASGLDVSAIRERVMPHATLRPVAIYVGLWAATVGVAWIGQSLRFTVTGHLPQVGESPFRLIAALDLALVVTPVAIAAVWLWARRVWGFIIAVVLNTHGAIYAALLSTASIVDGPVAAGSGGGLLALWVVFALGSLGSLVALLARHDAARGQQYRRPLR